MRAIKRVASGEDCAPHRLIFQPFSVLNARTGDWQDAKRCWLSLGIRSELGRDATTYQIGDKATWDRSKQDKVAILKSTAQASVNAMKYAGGFESKSTGTAGTSIFDPVLTELMYRWFCPINGQIVDPFAGGSVRGIIGGLLGYRYYGIELRSEQVEANKLQHIGISPFTDVEWVCGDSNVLMANAPEADFIFTCPPYGNLECYSDDPVDLSTMNYPLFVDTYRNIIGKCVENLKQNRLACFVVGEFRDKKTGMYQGFVADTIKAFESAGMYLYNEAILVTAIGSLPIRIGRQFNASRKLGKTHQNILVFAKGNPSKVDWGKEGNIRKKGIPLAFDDLV